MNQQPTLRELSRDPAKAENLLHALRHANDGYAITVWKDGGWCLWQPLDAKYAAMALEGTSDEVLVTIPVAELATITPVVPKPFPKQVALDLKALKDGYARLRWWEKALYQFGWLPK